MLWYAVQETYGGPAAYQRFVDACHARGLAVIQDVVYNHLGPSGNYLPEFGPYLARGRAQHLGHVDEPRRPESDEVRALHPRQRADLAVATCTSTGCGWTRCTPCVDPRAQHLLEELAEEAAELSAHLRPAARP